MTQQSALHQKTLAQAVRELNGLWLGYNSDVLLYDRQSDVYIFSEEDNYPRNENVELLCNFRTYSSALARLKQEQPADFSLHIVPADTIGTDLSVPVVFDINPYDDEFVATRAKSLERVALQQQNDDEFVVMTAVFVDKWVNGNEGVCRATLVKPNASGAGLRVLSKRAVMLINEREGVTPWALHTLRRHMKLPADLRVKFLYYPQSGRSAAQLVQEKPGGDEILLNIGSDAPMSMALIEQQMQQRAFRGDDLQIKFAVDHQRSLEVDEGGEFFHWSCAVDMDALRGELDKTVRLYVADGLSEYPVDPEDLREPLMHILSSRHATEMSGRQPVEKFAMEIALNKHIIGSPALVSMVNDAIVETVPGAKEISVSATRNVGLAIQHGLFAAYATLVGNVGVERANRDLPELFAKEGLSFSESMAQLSPSVRDSLNAPAQRFEPTVNRTDAFFQLAETALARQGLAMIAQTLPTQEPAQQLMTQEPLSGEVQALRAGVKLSQ